MNIDGPQHNEIQTDLKTINRRPQVYASLIFIKAKKKKRRQNENVHRR